MSGSHFPSPADDRRRRLAEALRLNLRRRKARARAAGVPAPDAAVPDAADAPSGPDDRRDLAP